jgi:hypothetical protein
MFAASTSDVPLEVDGVSCVWSGQGGVASLSASATSPFTGAGAWGIAWAISPKMSRLTRKKITAQCGKAR